MRLATSVVGLSLALSLMVTGAESAFAETSDPSSSVATATEQATPSASASSSASPSSSASSTATPSASASQATVDPASQASTTPDAKVVYRPGCDNLPALLTPAIRKKNALKSNYLGSSVAVGSAVDLKGWKPKEGAIFNNPNSSAQLNVTRQMLNGLRAATPGTTVRVAMYSLSRWYAAKAVIRAHCRGVNIQYLTDDHAGLNTATLAVKKILGASKSGSSFKACYLSCSSDYKWRGARVRVVTSTNPLYRPYMHSKYFTFSKLSGVPYVSMISSGNFTSTQAKNGWNNVYTAVKDKTTFNFLNNRLAEMWKDTSGNDYAVKTSKASPSKTTYFFPWAVAKPSSSKQTVNPATDPFTSFLENVKCTGMAKGYGNSQRRTQVLVSMYQWTSSRLYLARRLKQLKNKGCEVKVLMSASEWDLEVMPILRKFDKKKAKTTYKYGNISIRNGDRGSKFIHSKYIIVNGKWGSNTKAKLVFTGSGNWTKSALRFNNETSILVRSSKAYKQFKANWNKLWGSNKYSRPITKLKKKKTSRGDA